MSMMPARNCLALLRRSVAWALIVVEHKDRLTRFGFRYLDTLLREPGSSDSKW